MFSEVEAVDRTTRKLAWASLFMASLAFFAVGTLATFEAGFTEGQFTRQADSTAAKIHGVRDVEPCGPIWQAGDQKTYEDGSVVCIVNKKDNPLNHVTQNFKCYNAGDCQTGNAPGWWSGDNSWNQQGACTGSCDEVCQSGMVVLPSGTCMDTMMTFGCDAIDGFDIGWATHHAQCVNRGVELCTEEQYKEAYTSEGIDIEISENNGRYGYSNTKCNSVGAAHAGGPGAAGHIVMAGFGGGPYGCEKDDMCSSTLWYSRCCGKAHV